ncbi:HAMP domain-containing sensor histidine kinase [Microbacterium sp. AZCO]|uniref:sensor histidine kinase n=1 Tax=Microbacterium sp. AZCO TaxID=3142976 RepID=UPI0031F38A5E
MSPRRERVDADELLVRRTSLRVGLWITIAAAVLVVVVLAAAFWIVSSQVSLSDIFDTGERDDPVHVGSRDVLLAVLAIGTLCVLVVGTLALVATRQAVAPLVDALRRQRRFVADASHELRTPLTVLDTRLQVLERSLRADDEHREVVGALRRDSAGLIAVVDDLLDSVQSPADRDAGPISVAEAVRVAVDAMQMLAADRGVRLVGRPVAADVAVAMPEATLHRALVALIDNAVKHSSEGGSVIVEPSATRTQVRIAVSDEGSGIRGISPDRVFDRFARSSEAVDGGGSSRTGYGIGLFLVQDALTRYGGEASVVDTSDRGTTIAMRLPRAKASGRPVSD